MKRACESSPTSPSPKRRRETDPFGHLKKKMSSAAFAEEIATGIETGNFPSALYCIHEIRVDEGRASKCVGFFAVPAAVVDMLPDSVRGSYNANENIDAGPYEPLVDFIADSVKDRTIPVDFETLFKVLGNIPRRIWGRIVPLVFPGVAGFSGKGKFQPRALAKIDSPTTAIQTVCAVSVDLADPQDYLGEDCDDDVI